MANLSEPVDVKVTGIRMICEIKKEGDDVQLLTDVDVAQLITSPSQVFQSMTVASPVAGPAYFLGGGDYVTINVVNMTGSQTLKESVPRGSSGAVVGQLMKGKPAAVALVSLTKSMQGQLVPLKDALPMLRGDRASVIPVVPKAQRKQLLEAGYEKITKYKIQDVGEFSLKWPEGSEADGGDDGVGAFPVAYGQLCDCEDGWLA
jgi:hypothetical protein